MTMTLHASRLAAAALVLIATTGLSGCPEDTLPAGNIGGDTWKVDATDNGVDLGTDPGTETAQPDIGADTPQDIAGDLAVDVPTDAPGETAGDTAGDGTTGDGHSDDAVSDGTVGDGQVGDAVSDGTVGDAPVDTGGEGTVGDATSDSADTTSNDAAADAETDVPVCVEGTPCDDNLVGTMNDACDAAGACVGTVYTCTALQCEQSAVPNGVDCDVTNNTLGTTCDDGDPATTDDECDGAGTCAGLTLSCTPTQCQETSVPNGIDCDITYKDDGDGCDDGDNATQTDECDGAGTCAGTPYSCTAGTCEDTSTPNGTDCNIAYTAATTACDDGALDTHTDQCDGAGGCAGTPFTCTAGVCEASSVPDGAGCSVTPSTAGTECDDNDVTTNSDECNGAGSCAGTPYDCVAAQCELSSEHNGLDCDVVNYFTGFGCNDNNNSTRDDICNSGSCAGTPYTCPSPTFCQASNSPNGINCTIVNQPNGFACDDAETCTTPDTCQEGDCVGTSLCGNGSCDTICGEHAGTCATDCQVTGPGCNPPSENACTDWADCHSATTGAGLCGPGGIACGTFQVGNCGCDSNCVNFGDCCENMEAVCGCP